MQTTIVKWGNSQGIRLPKHILNSANLSDRDVVELCVEGENIIIKKSKKVAKYKTIQERFAGFEDDYKPTKINWGKPEGKEIW